MVLEYALTFFLVIAFAVGMATYVRRTVQARIHAGAHYVARETNSVFSDSSLNFVGNFFGQYEPYYQDSSAARERSSTYTDRVLPMGKLGIFEKTTNEVVSSTTESYQAPPVCGD